MRPVAQSAPDPQLHERLPAADAASSDAKPQRRQRKISSNGANAKPRRHTLHVLERRGRPLERVDVLNGLFEVPLNPVPFMLTTEGSALKRAGQGQRRKSVDSLLSIAYAVKQFKKLIGVSHVESTDDDDHNAFNHSSMENLYRNQRKSKRRSEQPRRGSQPVTWSRSTPVECVETTGTARTTADNIPDEVIIGDESDVTTAMSQDDMQRLRFPSPPSAGATEELNLHTRHSCVI